MAYLLHKGEYCANRVTVTLSAIPPHFPLPNDGMRVIQMGEALQIELYPPQPPDLSENIVYVHIMQTELTLHCELDPLSCLICFV